MTPADSAFRRYRTERSDDSFREVVAAYLPMVYGTALRLGGGNAAEAEDVSQMVFADLARKAPALREDASMGAWLHRHTCFLMKNTIRSHVRRRTREQAAAELLHPAASTALEEDWTAMESSLDRCLESLREADRRVLVLRFFEGRPLRDVGEALGIGDDAAQKRVSRALGRLRALLTDGRTAGVSAAMLAALLAGRSRAEVAADVAATMAGRALQLAGVRRGLLTPTTSWPAGRIIPWAAACVGIALGVWLIWPDKTGTTNRRGRSGSASVSRFGPPPLVSKAGAQPATARESVESVLARLRALVREPETSSNARAIAALIGAVPYEDLPGLATAIEDTGVSGILFRSFSALLQRWGDHDIAAAMSWFVHHVAEEGIPFRVSNPSERALRDLQPASPAALREWYASAMTAMTHGEGILKGVHEDVARKLGHLIAAKDPGAIEELLAAFPDRGIFQGSNRSLHGDIRTSTGVSTQAQDAVTRSGFSAVADAPAAEATVPTPAEYPALRSALSLPPDEAAAAVAENLQSWSKVAGPAPLHWAFAHLSRETARRMLEEVIPVWAHHDPAGVRAWFASGPPMDWQPADGSHCLTEFIISALAVNDPVAATDFLVNQCKTTSVQVKVGVWSNMSEFSRDIAAGITNADQCHEVLTLLGRWLSDRDQPIILLENAALARWKRWDAPAAQEWESSRSTR